MCGIIGYVGSEQCVPILLDGLKRLEYRGYDSAGVAVCAGGGIDIRKAKGKLTELEQVLADSPACGTTGIGHTRWATHGEPNYTNAHPHIDMKGSVAIVHNGILENYAELKRGLIKKGVTFVSDTDTEVAVQLIAWYYDGDMLSALTRVLPMMSGSFSLAIIDAARPDTLYCTRKDSPLIVGRAATGSLIASDVPAILKYSREVYYLDNMEIARLTQDTMEFFDNMGNPAEKQAVQVTWDADAAEKGGYEHFMLKEICEEPEVLQTTLSHYADLERMELRRECMPFTREQAQKLERLVIVACGTAYHAGLVGKTLIEKLARIRTDVDIASEYRYRDPILSADDTVVVVSQSGETADTVAALRKSAEAGCRIVALCNAMGSTIARESDFVMFNMAGPEIAVASTKAFITQQLLFELIALDLAHLRGNIGDAELKCCLSELAKVPQKARETLALTPRIQQFASRQMDCKNVFFIGRGLDYALSMEAALKLKEISYAHSEAYAAGELKHGTIALIESGSLVVAIGTQRDVYPKLMSNVEEVAVRGATVLLLSGRDDGQRETWVLPETEQIFMPLLAIIPMQLFAYFMALLKGCDIDKPRNLAKSVTVE